MKFTLFNSNPKPQKSSIYYLKKKGLTKKEGEAVADLIEGLKTLKDIPRRDLKDFPADDLPF